MKGESKYIKDWEKILVDTSALCALFRSQNSEVIDEQTQFVDKLFSFLSKNKTGESKDRIFYVSTITLSELLTRENDSEKIRRILKVLDSKNVEFIDFDLQVALQFNSVLYPHLSKAELHKVAANIGFKTGDFMMAREWITRDYMIIMSGVQKNVDVVLTADKNTFYPTCKNIGNAYCVLLYPQLFETSEKFVLNYYDDKVSDFLNPPKTEKLKSKEDGIHKKEEASKESAK